MRSFSVFATTVVTFVCLGAACGEDLDTSEAEPESSSAALVSRMPDRSQRIDLSRPGTEIRIDSSDEADMRRLEIVTEDGTTVGADEIIRAAAASAGISPKASSFMLRSRPTRPGAPTCSPRTQTDCCACGFWSLPTGLPPFCQALWCPCTGNGCPGDMLQAK